MNGNRSVAKGWETWTKVINPDKSVSFKSAEGYYLCAEKGGGTFCNADRI